MTNISIQEQQQNITVSEPRADYHLPVASETTLGGIKVGNNLTITEDGVLSAESTEYQLPTATASTLGGIKVGENLSINDGILTADVDSVLNVQSTNPVQNNVITSSLNYVDSTLTELDDRLDTAESNYSNLSNAVITNTSDIAANTDDISVLQSSVSENSDDIASNTGAIADNLTAINSLKDRMDTAESDITNQGTAIDELGGEVNDFTISIDTDVDYSYLLPVNVWSDGAITYSRRGKTGLIQFDLTGTYDLQSEVNSQIYQLPDTFQNAIPCSGVLITNDGCIEVKIDINRNIKFYNHDSVTKHIIEIKGQLSVVLE